MKIGWMIFVVILGMGAGAMAQSPQAVDCQQVQQQLQGMQAAQTALLKSFVEKNLAMADTMNRHATLLKKSDKKAKQVKALQTSAQGFRDHYQREAELIARFEKASKEVVELAAKCMQTKKLDQVADQSLVNAAKLGQR